MGRASRDATGESGRESWGPDGVREDAPGKEEPLTVGGPDLVPLRAAAKALAEAKQAAADAELEVEHKLMRIRRAYGLKTGDRIDLTTGRVLQGPPE